MKTLKVFNVLMMTILFASTNWSCRHARVIESTKIDTITTMKKMDVDIDAKIKVNGSLVEDFGYLPNFDTLDSCKMETESGIVFLKKDKQTGKVKGALQTKPKEVDYKGTVKADVPQTTIHKTVSKTKFVEPSFFEKWWLVFYLGAFLLLIYIFTYRR